MSTPEQDRKKELSFGEQLRRQAEQQAQAVETGAQADAEAIQKLADEQKANDAATIARQQGINKDYKDAAESANNDYYKILEAAYRQREEAYNADKAADAEQYRKEADRAQWMGLTELVASIANAIGVANGASNQTIKIYSRDWMQQADRKHRERRQRLEQARETLAARGDAMNRAKLEGILKAAGIDRENAQAILGLEASAAKNYASAGAKAAEALSKGRENAERIRYDGEVKAIAADRQEAKQRRAEGQRQAQWNAKMRMSGYNPDGTVNEEYMNEVQRIARLSSSSSVSGSGKGFNLTFSEGNGLPAITYRIQSDSLENTIAANIDKLTGEDKALAKEIRILAQTKSGEALSQALLPYAKNSKAMRDLIKMSAESYWEGETPQPAPAPAEQAQELTKKERRKKARQQRREELKRERQTEEGGLEGTGLGSTYN